MQLLLFNMVSFKIDDADYKRTIIVNNISFRTPIKKLYPILMSFSKLMVSKVNIINNFITLYLYNEIQKN